MVVSGKFVAVKEEGLKDLLTSEGVPADRVAEWATLTNNVVDIKVDGSKVVISQTLGNRPARVTEYIVGQEKSEKWGEKAHKATANITGNDIKVDTVREEDGTKRSLVYKSTDSGMEVLHITEKGKAKVIYNRA